MRALVVSSDKEVAEFMGNILEKQKCKVDYAFSTDAAVAMAPKNRYIAVVLTDVCRGKTDVLDVADTVKRAHKCNRADILLIYSGRKTLARMRSRLGTRLNLYIHKEDMKTFPFSSHFKVFDVETKETGNIRRK